MTTDTSLPDRSYVYDLSKTTSSTFTLPDGRSLGYIECGDLSGAPIFYFHGWPSSRKEGVMLEPQASRVHARIISIDRPGFGLSSPHPGRTLLSHADDVRLLAEHLSIERYGVLGISGGGPYALAAAKSMPAEKLKAVSIVCGLGPPDIGYSGMNWFHYLGWAGGGWLFPWILRLYFSREPEGRLDLDDEERLRRVKTVYERSKAGLNPKDAEFFGDEECMHARLDMSRDTYAHGMYPCTDDFYLLNNDFGFKVEDIRKDLPVHIWHGKLDDSVPPSHGIKVADRISGSARLHLTDDTHASVHRNQKENFLSELVTAIRL